MRRIAALAAFTMVGLGGVAEAERLVVPPIAAPAELADEAGSIDLLVRSSLAKITLVEAPAASDHTATAELSRAGTGLQLDVTIVAHDGSRETVSVVAGDGDIVTLAGGMVDKIGAVIHATPQPVRAFALGQLRPYAAALRIAKADPAGAIARLADAAPAVALGVPAIPLAFGDLVAAAPNPTARLVVARAVGATDVVAAIGAGKDSVAAAARAYAAIDRADLATAETELGNVGGGLGALGRAAIAAEHDDVRLGGLLQEALASDQQRAALALASTIVPAHVSPSVHRSLLPLAERAAATSPGVTSRIGFSAAQAKVEPARSLALVSVRELDQYSIDQLPAILDAHPDIAKATLLRLRAELAMRKHQNMQAAVDAYLAGAPTDPRALQYAAWSKLPPKLPQGKTVVIAPTNAADDDFLHHVNEPRSGAIDLVLPIVAGVGVLVLVTLLVLQRRKRRAPPPAAAVFQQPAAKSVTRNRDKAISIAPATAPAPPTKPNAKLKIDMTTPTGQQPPLAQASPERAEAPKTSIGRSLPASSQQSELGDRLQGLIDVELPADLPVEAAVQIAAPPPPREMPIELPPTVAPRSALAELPPSRPTPPAPSALGGLHPSRLTPPPPSLAARPAEPERLLRAKSPAIEAGSALSAFAEMDPFGDSAAPSPPPVAPPPPAPRKSSAFDDVELGAPDLMPLGSDPKLQFPSGSMPSHDLMDFALDAPGSARGELEHPNIIKPGATDKGKSLAAILAERVELPWLEAVGIIDQVCAGLAHAHANDVVHGGVQPATIFVTNRVARVGDFNIVNRPPFAAPDRSGKPADDLYAIGATLAEMLKKGEVPEKLTALVASLRSPTAAGRPGSVDDVRAAFKALFDF